MTTDRVPSEVADRVGEPGDQLVVDRVADFGAGKGEGGDRPHRLDFEHVGYLTCLSAGSSWKTEAV